MDEFKLRLSSRFMRTIISKLVSKAIYKKYGCKVSINIGELNVEMMDGETDIHMGLDLKVDSKEFMKLMKSIGED